ncbi:MAG: hypothetical protein ACXW1W_03800 [Methylococcaceae bacterium]
MKPLALVMITGVILLYFLDTAFKIQLFNAEMLVHSAIRFFTGFFLIGVGVFYAHKIKLKSAVYFVLALFLLDDISDYYRNVESFRFELMIHEVFIMLWGAVTGYVSMSKKIQPE